ncbi:hypothetical protein [Tuberibacillus calidus]|jgi:hypothetical protein|uniref:hypothetical protein n=1 Tax=Tuberibacillus calidus TaxID=340097 RepID=UPI0003F8E953|nr:hypothetical protein [Tuberibacillus calidus]
MRLTKTLYIVEEIESDEPIGYDSLGRPVYGTTTVKTPFMGEVEPYSSELTHTRYGLVANVTHRVFCLPNDKLKLNQHIEWQDKDYTLTGLLKYDRHFEVLINEGYSP